MTKPKKAIKGWCLINKKDGKPVAIYMPVGHAIVFKTKRDLLDSAPGIDTNVDEIKRVEVKGL